ncbi:MAG: HNH endonuclease signature motif containing protein [Sulfitobacter sp.]
MSKSRKPPDPIARRLRQEAGFGCAECGNPIVEYHHIIEWNELKHFDPEHMVALCPNHHAEFGKLAKGKAYAVKENPHNIRSGRIYGYLGGNKNQKKLRVGAMMIEDCKSAIDFGGNSILSYKLVDQEYQLDAFLPDQNFWPEIEISRNYVAAITSDFWDIEFKTNWVKFRRAKGDIFLSIDFRKDEVEIDGFLSILGQDIDLKKSQNRIGGGTLSNVYIKGCKTALSVGPDGKIHRPNFAMTNPKMIFTPRK